MMVSTRRFGSFARTVLCVAGLLAVTPRPAFAGPFALETEVGANLGGSINLQLFGPDKSYAFGRGAGFVALTDVSDGIVDTQFTYSAAANAQFGKLQARASGDFNLSTPDTRNAISAAGAVDLLTIALPGLNGQAGTLDFSYVLDGMLSSSGAGTAEAIVAVEWGGNAPFAQLFHQFNTYASVPSGAVTVPINFIWGQPFYLSLTLASVIGTPVDLFNETSVPQIGAGSGSADFYNTLLISGLLPRDQNGNQILDAQFSSASGTQYGVNGVVPEPGSLFLLGSGLAMVARRRLRRARV